MKKTSEIDKIEKREVMNIDEAAAMLSLSKSYIYRLTSLRMIPHYKPSGKMLYFERSELIKWALSNPIATKDNISAIANQYCNTNHI